MGKSAIAFSTNMFNLIALVHVLHQGFKQALYTAAVSPHCGSHHLGKSDIACSTSILCSISCICAYPVAGLAMCGLPKYFM